MKSELPLIKSYKTVTGLEILLVDRTSHYFGGYYHVRVDINVDVPVKREYFSDQVDFADVASRIGQHVLFQRRLEKMAVHSDELEVTKAQLVESFEKTMLTYLQHVDFSRRFVASAYAKRCRKTVITPW